MKTSKTPVSRFDSVFAQIAVAYFIMLSAIALTIVTSAHKTELAVKLSRGVLKIFGIDTL